MYYRIRNKERLLHPCEQEQIAAIFLKHGIKTKPELFAVGHLIHCLFCITGHTDQLNGIIHYFPVFRLKLTEPVCVGSTPQRYHILAAKIGDAHFVGGYETNAQRPATEKAGTRRRQMYLILHT